MPTTQATTRNFAVREGDSLLREQARLEHVEDCKRYLLECRNGQVRSNGYNLWTCTQRLGEDIRVSLEEIGASLEELRSYLIACLSGDLTRAREAKEYTSDLGWDWVDLIMMLDDKTVTYQELGTTEEEIVYLEAEFVRLIESQKSKA